MLTSRAHRKTEIETAEGSLAGMRVLIVEDEALVALDLDMTVRGEGGAVVGPHGRLGAALRAAEGETIDLAILDIMLGRDEVFPVARALERRGVPFLFHSGHADPAALNRDFPEAGFCPKPCGPGRILETLARLGAARVAEG